jgi:SAM-dependent methyltransferase
MSLLRRAIKRGLDTVLAPFGLEARRRSRVHWDPVIYKEWEEFVPPRRLWVTPEEPAFQFARWTFTWYAYLTLLCDLARDSSVLELGCSHGRTMLALVNYLVPPGRYEGLDILPEQVEFAQRVIHARYPHFNFSVASDLYNTNYNPRGKTRPDSYRFPYADGSFDVIYAASVFTHLIPPDAANYLEQSRRVLRPGGRCLFSWCILDYYRGFGTTSQPFMELEQRLDGFDGVAVRNAQNPEQLIAFSTSVLEKMAADAGLRIARIIPGSWSMSHRVAVSEQDLVLFEAV